MTVVLSVSRAPGHVPLEVTAFIGRRHDRSHVRRLMETSHLVTLTGFGGIGKTRLALRVAHDLRRIFADGVYFISLGELHRADRVPDQIADALGLEGRARQKAAIGLVEYLRERNALLILDNCEHVIDVAAQIADTILRTCPEVRLLVTSREPLRITGEAVYAVRPLTAPGVGSGATPLQSFEAVQLFLDRARSVMPEFELTDANRDSVAAICRKLEGIPLALELAAARLRTLSPAELENELSDQWEVLSRGPRNAPNRQSTMSACIDWSFDLCTDAEQLLWANASVFLDGFELDAAIAVCSGESTQQSVLDVLSALIDKSVLTISRHGAASRYQMLPPLRQRGLAELARLRHADEIRRRHRDFYAALAARAHEEFLSSRQLDWIQRLRREVANIREALDFSAAKSQEGNAGVGAIGNLMWWLSGLEGLSPPTSQHWSARLLEHGQGDPESEALALRTACWWAAAHGDLDAAEEFLEQGGTAAIQAGGATPHLLTQAKGYVAMLRGHLDRAEALLSDAAIGLESSGSRLELVHTTLLLGFTRTFRDDVDGAVACHERCLELTPSGELWFRSWSLWVTALALFSRGDVQQADGMLKKSLELSRMTSARLAIALTVDALAWLAAETDPERAAALLGAAQNEWDRLEMSTAAIPGLDLRHREAMSKAQGLLGDKAFDDAWARGRSLQQETAISIALGEKATRTSPQSPGRGEGASLTPRQQEIATLIHQGLSNKEIAETLVISVRTAEAHVEGILRTLGFTKRSQVASWVAEQHPGH